MRRSSLLWPTCLCLLAVACTERETVGPSARQPVLLGAVVEGADTVFVTMGRSGVGVANLPIPDAALVLRHGEREWSFESAEDGVCGGPAGFACYVARIDPRVVRGVPLELTGAAGGVGDFSAGTTLPPPPPVTVGGTPAGGTIRLGALGAGPSIPVRIAAGSNAIVLAGDFGAPVTVWTGAGPPVSCTTGFLLPTARDLRSGSHGQEVELELAIPAPRQCEGGSVAAWDSLEVELTFMHYDENMSDWLRADAEVLEAPGYGTSGIYGFFGSASTAVWFVRATP